MTYHASLFGGIRIFDLAAQLNGIESLFNSEINEFCIKIGQQYYSGHEIGSVETADFRRYKGMVKFLTGGFPCQDISRAKGISKGIDGPRSGLWRHFYRAIQEIHPGYVIVENSDQLTRKGIETILCDFARIGYDAEWLPMAAAQFGARHIRRRTWILAYPQTFRRTQILSVVQGCGTKGIEKKKCPKCNTSSDHIQQFEQSQGEPSIFGMDDGPLSRLHLPERIGALGNSIYWVIPYLIIKTILEVEKMTDENYTQLLAALEKSTKF